MPHFEPTYIGQVASVTGSLVRIRLREDMSSTFIMIDGKSYRIGQIGGFCRIPLGFYSLYGICTQIGADAAPDNDSERVLNKAIESEVDDEIYGYRWMSIVLFGESISHDFERGVGQYPTIGDEVHLVTDHDLEVIYGSLNKHHKTIPVGQIASSSGISAEINIAGLVSRHSFVVGSTGSGKSNLVTVLLESVSNGKFPSARTIVIDPHGEYSSALGNNAEVYSVSPECSVQQSLWIPFWALPFSEIVQLTFGKLNPTIDTAIRDIVRDMKREAAKNLNNHPPEETITADSPIPFSIYKLWYDLDRFERMTFNKSGIAGQDKTTVCNLESEGNAEELIPAMYPAASPYNSPPYKNAGKRNIEKELELMRSRLLDPRFSFLFKPGDGLNPNIDSTIESDIDTLVASWVGHEKPISIFDVSALPSEILPLVVGTLLRII